MLNQILNVHVCPSKKLLVYSIALDLNSQPNITNLPASVSVDEDIAGGTVIFTLTSQDLDPTDPLTHSFSVSPITAQGLFSFDSASKYINSPKIFGL